MFRDTSDIDLLIVSSTLFDELWISLLSAAYPRKSVAENLGGWLERKRNEVYTGYLNPSDIKLDAKIYGAPARPVLALRTKWFTALNEASQFPIRGFEAIKGRLYRTWQHAKLYHLNSLASPNAGSRGSISDSGGRTRRQGGWGDVRLRAVRSAISIVNRYQLSSLPGLDPAIHRLRKSILQRTNTWHSVRSL
jgi:hypothetical protein